MPVEGITSEVIESIREHITELRQHISASQSQIDAWKEQIESWNKLLELSQDTQPPGQPALPGPYSNMSSTRAAEIVLREKDRLPLKEIGARLTAGGWKSKAKYPLRSLGAALENSPKFVRVGPATFALASLAKKDDVVYDIATYPLEQPIRIRPLREDHEPSRDLDEG